ncbi:4-(cytidine 5'-diphospho)-2-C-methyl-D-erythritol kinase [Ottowia thiooxydans]|uniref:4-(cytidine 5'-diphospho)-2-C-methyl-D-erythritol kinase n=1 Tax=Ottowia thiooxydans TaxID=219182 RepID=UPI00041A4B93|nr:4-(cytidine 5'-diphospho)-2-C-methyl-D-erythritol kinase [Ottowia thiooxydans]
MRAIFDVPAPAKLNLFLHINGRRPDGYHLLQSVFMLIDWCDTLHFELRSDGAVSREDLSGPALPADDLCTRAARALKAATGCTDGVHIGLHKRLPAQAGLGGGSSDAATTLLALNRLWNLGLNRGQLEAIGLSLGADVPFFLRGRNAWVEGVGERITPIELPAASFLVIKPPVGLETKAIFSDEYLKRDTNLAILAGFAANPWGFGHNDLQPVAERLCPLIAEGLATLSEHGLQGRMTGSGSALFARSSNGVPAKLVHLLESANWQIRDCSNMAIHPLVGWVASDN